MHIVSIRQFLDRGLIERLFSITQEKGLPQGSPFLSGRTLACLFYEPSTRTRLSFEAAMHQLGGSVISSEHAGQFSSAIKGESLEDTIRVVGGYADAIVLRHPERGAARRAAAVSDVPVINAGDGDGEHPTQALLDLYTIREECGRMDDLHICLAGDLRYGRTVHSLVQLLSVCANVRLTLASPPELTLPERYLRFLERTAIPFVRTERLDVAGVDVLYMTRIQKERFARADLYQRVRDRFILTAENMRHAGPRTVIMHPLPRVNEIAVGVDGDRRAAYFRQARNGLAVRKALLRVVMAG